MTESVDKLSEDYLEYYLEEGGDLNYIAPEHLSNAFRIGYYRAIQDAVKIISTRPFSMNLELVKEAIQKLR
jgi:hypothetical protein